MKITLNKNSKYYTGYFYGLRHPSLHLQVEVDGTPHQFPLEKLHLLLSEKFSIEVNSLNEDFLKKEDKVVVLSFLLQWIYNINKSLEISSYEVGKIKQISIDRYILLIPCMDIKDSPSIIKIIENLIKFISMDSKEHTIDTLNTLFKSINPFPHNGTNVPRFFKAAFKMGIPFNNVVDNLQQYGYGSKSRLMDSSFTDNTSNIAARICRDKSLASSFFNQAGIPIAKQVKVNSKEQALKAAEKIGYPVVIKPADLDGGAGVFAGINNPENLSKLYDEVEKHSKNILIEKHIFGKDYRLNVFNGEILWAIERIPAGVTGDGKKTIEELVKATNEDKRRGETNTQSLMKQLSLDDEALELLKEAKFTPKTVLEKDVFVPLRRKANISAGGTPIAVMDKIHPDNKDLAIRATKLLNLDLAGIDIITKDISKSWKEDGGVICEINSQPQLGGVTSSHTYQEVLKKLIKGNGRIPIILILEDEKDLVLNQLKNHYLQKGIKVGTLESKGISINNSFIQEGKFDVFKGGKILMMNRDVEMAIINIKDTKVLNTGLPFDRYSFLIIENENVSKETLSALLPASIYGVLNITENNKLLQNYNKIIHTRKDEVLNVINELVK